MIKGAHFFFSSLNNQFKIVMAHRRVDEQGQKGCERILYLLHFRFAIRITAPAVYKILHPKLSFYPNQIV